MKKKIVIACLLGSIYSTAISGQTGGYLPWTLKIDGYLGGDTCEVTELARSFDEAKAWMFSMEGVHRLFSIKEEKDAITFLYHDGRLGKTSLRTFFKDMKTCEKALSKH